MTINKWEWGSFGTMRHAATSMTQVQWGFNGIYSIKTGYQLRQNGWWFVWSTPENPMLYHHVRHFQTNPFHTRRIDMQECDAYPSLWATNVESSQYIPIIVSMIFPFFPWFPICISVDCEGWTFAALLVELGQPSWSFIGWVLSAPVIHSCWPPLGTAVTTGGLEGT